MRILNLVFAAIGWVYTLPFFLLGGLLAFFIMAPYRYFVHGWKSADFEIRMSL